MIADNHTRCLVLCSRLPWCFNLCLLLAATLRQVLWVSSCTLRHSIALICDDLLILSRLAREALKCAHSSEHSIPVARHDSFHIFRGRKPPTSYSLSWSSVLECFSPWITSTHKSRCSYWYWLEVELGHTNCCKITQKISGRVLNSVNVFLNLFFLFWLK